jgi:hypothetical protein
VQGSEPAFRRVLAEVRREIAARHLIERQPVIGEIAFIVEFSEARDFIEATSSETFTL